MPATAACGPSWCRTTNRPTPKGIDKSELPQIMQNNLQELNRQLAAYERVSDITIYPTEFEKTPKRSIKRFLYSASLLDN